MNNTSMTCVIPDRISGSGLIVISVIAAVVATISITGNGLIIIAFATTKSLIKPANILLTNLALGDLLYGLIGSPLYFISDFFPKLHCSLYFPGIRIFVLAALLLVSLNNIAIIAFERCIGIEFPFFYQAYVTNKKSVLLVVFSWAFSAVRAAVVANLWFTNLRAALLAELPILILLLILTVVIYGRVYLVSRRHLLKDVKCGILKQESKAQAAVMIAAINAISWAPVISLRCLDAMGVDLTYWNQATFLSPFIGTCLNLKIYTYRMSDFRRAIRRLLRRQEQVDPWIRPAPVVAAWMET